MSAQSYPSVQDAVAKLPELSMLNDNTGTIPLADKLRNKAFVGTLFAPTNSVSCQSRLGAGRRRCSCRTLAAASALRATRPDLAACLCPDRRSSPSRRLSAVTSPRCWAIPTRCAQAARRRWAAHLRSAAAWCSSATRLCAGAVLAHHGTHSLPHSHHQVNDVFSTAVIPGKALTLADLKDGMKLKTLNDDTVDVKVVT